MAFKGQKSIVPHHATAIVGDLNQLFAASFYVDPDARGTGIQRVLQQLFDHRGRALHHLSGGDLVGYVF